MTFFTLKRFYCKLQLEDVMFGGLIVPVLSDPLGLRTQLNHEAKHCFTITAEILARSLSNSIVNRRTERIFSLFIIYAMRQRARADSLTISYHTKTKLISVSIASVLLLTMTGALSKWIPRTVQTLESGDTPCRVA